MDTTSLTNPQPMAQEPSARQLGICAHGRTAAHCTECMEQARARKATGDRKPKPVVKLEQDTLVPHPRDPNRSTFYAAGSYLPADDAERLEQAPKRRRAATRKGR